MADVGATASGAGAGGDSSSSVRLSSSYVKVGDRTMFTVELRPGETTIVSWKKLVKDAAKGGGGGDQSVRVPEPPTNAHPSLEARLAPGEPAANDLKDPSAPHRFSAVIEKIERLYMGKDSSEDEDMGDIPDDQYDTEDSFIDDVELNEYFEVDKSKIKHDGYFVNRGALEKVESLESPHHQPKKRRKEMAKDPILNDLKNGPIKHRKVGKKGAGKSASSVEKSMVPATHDPSVKNIQNVKIQSHSNAPGTCHQKIPGDGQTLSEISQSFRASNGNTFPSLAGGSDKPKTDMLNAKNPSSKSKENNIEQSEIVKQQKGKSGIHERIDLNLPDTKPPTLPVYNGSDVLKMPKTSLVHKKDGSSIKPKANSLEKAIRELERMVAELRPPTADAQDVDATSSVKRRLPREIKLKLAKVARLSNANNGKVSKELLNRLMGIIGHLCQMRTLKRHLKIMMDTSFSAKQEKDDKFQQIKKEVIELIKARIPLLMSKGAEQPSGGSVGVQESGHPDKALKGQHCIDATLEDKICDLYDIFVDGLDEDAAPQVRKLYTELAELWPRGVMDNHGIKRAICRAKERKRSLNETKKDQEKIRRKVVATKIEDCAGVESSSFAQLPRVDLRLPTDPSIAVVQQNNRHIPSTTSSATAMAINPTNITAAQMPLPSTNLPSFERPKHEKVKGTHNSSSVNDARVVDGVVVKKKVKRKTEFGGEGHLHPNNISSQQDDNIQKLPKHVDVATSLQSAPQKPTLDMHFNLSH